MKLFRWRGRSGDAQGRDAGPFLFDANAHFWAGRYADAEAAARGVLSAGPHPAKYAAGAMGLAAGAVHAQGRHGEALAMYDEAVPLCSEALGPTNVRTLALRSSRAQVLAVLARYAESEEGCAEVFRLAARRRGPVNAEITVAAQNGLIYALNGQGRHQEAEALAREALVAPVILARASVDRFALVLILGLARSLNGQERYEEALAEAARADELCRALAEDLRRTEIGTVELITGNALLGLGRITEARASATAAHDACLAAFGPEHYRTREARGLLDRIAA